MSLGLRAYARRRRAAGLTGGTLRAVQVAIETGRLSSSLTADRKGIADPDLADREWAASTLEDRIPLTGRSAAPPAAAPPPPDVPPLHESRARREAALAKLAEHELAEHEGKFIDVDRARADVIATFTLVRTRLLGIPARARQRDPSLTAAQVAMIDELLREALEELSGPTEEGPC